MLLKDFSFDLPEYLIATKPAFPRDSSKLLYLLSRDQYEETQFSRICDYLLPGRNLYLFSTCCTCGTYKKKNINTI